MVGCVPATHPATPANVLPRGNPVPGAGVEPARAEAQRILRADKVCERQNTSGNEEARARTCVTRRPTAGACFRPLSATPTDTKLARSARVEWATYYPHGQLGIPYPPTPTPNLCLRPFRLPELKTAKRREVRFSTPARFGRGIAWSSSPSRTSGGSRTLVGPTPDSSPRAAPARTHHLPAQEVERVPTLTAFLRFVSSGLLFSSPQAMPSREDR